jgi:hypothetical protein
VRGRPAHITDHLGGALRCLAAVKITVEPEAGHLSLVSHPQEITDLILAAAGRGK